ncbi:hypothetical protein K443DRAFT_11345 [Laccaria amethystina LaAM-08-1]|uniref:Uncharacterized protein n=1 Tax=Laccaria amethystina LaAM-08-1 TaxID=1095629 RepID=A0A0C9XCM4_9AGAR|nr:hypothetical protein K443DRAFT_11345 [Laccaria amethystina LaAM-08-1]
MYEVSKPNRAAHSTHSEDHGRSHVHRRPPPSPPFSTETKARASLGFSTPDLFADRSVEGPLYWVSDAPSLTKRKDQELGAVLTNGPNQAPYLASRGDMFGRRTAWDLLHPIPLIDGAAH